jgi:hypothetical protein
MGNYPAFDKKKDVPGVYASAFMNFEKRIAGICNIFFISRRQFRNLKLDPPELRIAVPMQRYNLTSVLRIL